MGGGRRQLPIFAFHSRAGGRNLLPLGSILLQFIVQRLEADAEDFGGAGFVVARRFQGFDDELALGLVHGGAHADVDAIGVADEAARPTVSEARRQMARLDDRGVADDDGALQAVAQLAHVARPGELIKQAQHGVADGAHAALVLVVHGLDEGLGEGGNVFLVVAQGGHVDVEDVEAVVEIVAQLAAGDGFFGNLVGGGQDADIDGGFGLAAEAAQLAVFEDAEQLGLGADRHLADFVEQEGAAFGQLEAAGAALQGSGEGAFLVAEDLAFDEGFRDGGAVDGDKGLVLAGRKLVDGAGDQLLAGAAFAGDEDRGGAGGDQLDEAEDLLHLGRGADQASRAFRCRAAGGGWPRVRARCRAGGRRSAGYCAGGRG